MFAASVLASFVTLATPRLSPAVVHERRAAPPLGWFKLGSHAADAVLPLRFGLKQSNIDRLEELLLDVSHPESPNYGQHWSPAKVAATFAPSAESIDAVKEWLGVAGVHPERVRLTAGKAWLELKSVSLAL
jgi:tripeptidyl-peptidase-1